MAALILLVCLLASVLPAHAQTVAQREFCGVPTPGVPGGAAPQGWTRAARVGCWYLDPLIYPHRYVPAKNSFIFQNLKRGERNPFGSFTRSSNSPMRYAFGIWAMPIGSA